MEETPAELPQQPEAALACLTLVQKFMAGAKDLRKFGAMDMLVHQFILPGIQREDAVLRDMAIRCLGLCCMFDRSMAQTHVLLFLQALEVRWNVGPKENTLKTDVTVAAFRACGSIVATTGYCLVFGL